MEVANVSPKTDCQTQGVLKIPVVIGLKMAFQTFKSIIALL